MDNSERQEIHLQQFVSDILAHHGGIVEHSPQGVDFLLPTALASTLQIPENGRLNFTCADAAGETTDASYDSELFVNIGRLFQSNGKLATATFPAYEPGSDKIVKTLRDRLALTNAVANPGKIESGEIDYLLAFFKYVAFSDERQEGVVPILVQEQNRSVAEIEENGMDLLSRLGIGEAPTDATSCLPSLSIAGKAAETVVKRRTQELVQNLEKRLNRDVKRVCDYYQTLTQEAQKQLEKKTAAENRRQGNLDELQQQTADKLNAITSEQAWKIQDLISQYALKVELQPLACVRIHTSSLIFHLAIKRRLASRKIALSYNPLLRQLDRLPCEACFCPDGTGYSVCDEQLHIVCSDCSTKCPACQKQFCPVCHPQGCPKCQRVSPN